MERRIKQLVLSILVEYALTFLLVLAGVAAVLSSNIFSIYSDLFLEKESVLIGLVSIVFVFLSYRFYANLDKEIIQNMDLLVKNIMNDQYSSAISVYEIRVLQNAFRRKSGELKKKDDFLIKTVSYLSHDMKTPVTVINANVDLLRRNNDVTTQDGLNRISRIECESIKISTYITNLMDITASLTENAPKERIALNSFVPRVINNIEIYSELIEDHIVIQNMTQRLDDLYIKANFEKIDKCIVHLLNNAFEHKNRKVSAVLETVEKFITIRIFDDGMGFDTDSLQRGKEMFYMGNFGRTSGKGYGVGLYYVDSYMKSIGGSLEIQNQTYGGGEQIINIPLIGGRDD